MSAALGAVPRTGLSSPEPLPVFAELRELDGLLRDEPEDLDRLPPRELCEPEDEDRPAGLRLSAIPVATIPPVHVPRATRKQLAKI